MSFRKLLLAVLGLLCFGLTAASAYNFSISTLNGVTLGGVTSLQFGPDHRLYLAQVDGQIKVLTVERVAPNNYQVTATETILLVKSIPNYDDSGIRNFALTSRQVTGILVTGTATNPIIYVTSSDPRIGGGSGGENDLNLDTNSGVLSRLTRTDGTWSKVDLVRGLPRSEENHASNGMQWDPTSNILYLAQGGNTNAGGPSINFAYACETALSAAILSIDLNVIDAMPIKTDPYGQKYLYDLPTLNDPNPERTHNPNGSDFNDPFGGNDGLNQAKLVPGGPVQVYASGFRNPYDLVITHAQGREGRMYTIDNAANPGWGGYPKNEGPSGTVTNEYPEGEPGTVHNNDNLHLIPGPGYYGGHPNPLRANPAGAGWFHYDNKLPAGSQKIYSLNPTSDWPAVPVSMANPIEGDYRTPGITDGALLTYPASTNGLTEYVATNFSGEMQGNLIAATYDGKLLRIALNAAGTGVTNGVELLASGFGDTPLDVTAPDPGHGAQFLGTIWVGHYLSRKISILEPADFDNPGSTTCTGINSVEVDEDGDGFSNADEIANSSDPCSGSIRPADADGDKLSDLRDPDDDNDGITDLNDTLPLDHNNGRSVPLPIHYELFNETGIGFYGVGFTGLMKNRGENYSPRMSTDNIVAGGTAGLFTIAETGPGTARGGANSQKDAYQFGFNSDEFTAPYAVEARLAGPFFGSTPTGNQTQGIFLGYGDQDNYVSVALHANGGLRGIEVVYEVGGVVAFQQIYPLDFSTSSTVDLSFLVDPVAGTVQPRYELEGSTVPVPLGTPIATGGDVLLSLMGRYPLSIGLFANTGGAGAPTFSATFDFFDVAPVTSTAVAKIVIDPNASSMATSSTYLNGSFKISNLSTGGQQIESVAFDISTSIFPDVVFDTKGTAGDPVAKAFQADTATGGVLLNTAVMTLPHNGTNSDDGYDGVDIAFDAFPVNGLFAFSIDNDPNNVKGVPQPGENDAASISGLELIGTTVSVFFDDGTVQRTRVGRVENSVDGSYGWVRSDKPPKPAVLIVGQPSPVTTGQSQHTIRVIGPAGYNVSLVTIEGALYLGGVPGGGYNVEPYDANTAIKVTETSGVIPASGFIDLSVTLTKTDEKSGLNYITATLSNADGIKGAASDRLVLWYDPSISAGDTQAPTAPTGLAASDVSARSITLTWSPSTDNVGIVGYNILRNGTLLTSVPSLSYTDFGLDPGVNYSYSVVAKDDAGNTSTPATLAVPTPNNGTVVLRVNAGGPAFVDSAGHTWAADNGFNTGSTATTTSPIDRTVDDALFKTERADTSTALPDLMYSLNVPNGQYEVQLFFAEVTTATAAVGKRVFNISLEGQLVFPNFDIFARAGAPYTAVMAAASTTVADGQLNIAFGRNKANPKVNAIKVVRLAAAETEPPTIPANLVATEITTTSVTLGWEPSTDNNAVTGYVITRDGTVIHTTAELTFTDQGLTPATNHQYMVRARDEAGNLSDAATISVTTLGASSDTEAPTQPGPITFSNIAPTSVTLTWTASSDNTAVTGYRISRNNVLLSTVTELTFSDSTLSPATQYAYSVVAIDAAGNASAARTGEVTTLAAPADTQPPTLPGPIAFSNVTATTATLTWTASTDNTAVTGYRVSRDGTVLNTVSNPTYSDSALTAGTVYTYSIVAIDAAANESTARTGSVTTTSSGPTSAIRINAGGPAYTDSLGNVWSADTGFNTGASYSNTATVAGTPNPNLFKTERYDAPALPELTYTVSVPNGGYLVRLHFAETYTGTKAAGRRVFDVNLQGTRVFEDVDIFTLAGGGNKALTLEAPVSVTTGQVQISFIHQVENPKVNAIEIIPDTQAPTAPTDLAATNITPTSLTLTWTASSDNFAVTGYRVSRDGVLLATVTETTYSDANLTPETSYAYSVVAVDTSSNTSAPAVLNAATAPAPDTQAPTQPGALSFTSVTQTSLTLSWSASTDNRAVTGYQVSRNGSVLDTVTGLTFSDSALAAGTTYTYSVAAIDAAANASTPRTGSITTANGSTTGTIRINAGGAAYTDTAGNVWSADTGFNTGVKYSTTATVTGTTEPTLYKTERYDSSAAPELTYTISVPNGAYTVRLHFAETYASTKGAGLRVFDINLQGQRVFEDVDIFTRAGGGNKALVLEAPVNATAGQVQISFLRQLQNPKVNAIEVIPNLTDTQPPSAPADLAATEVTTTSLRLNWAASTDNVEVTGYNVYRDAVLLGTVTTNTYEDANLTPDTQYSYSVVARDAAGNTTSSVPLSVRTAVPFGGIRVNAGGPQYVDTAGHTWLADTGYNTGKTLTDSAVVSGTTHPQLFRSLRYDELPVPELAYTFTVPNGSYRVRLHMAETNGSLKAVGKRVFDVDIQGSRAFEDVDIFARVGGNTALVLEAPAAVTNGQIQIRFIHQANHPRIQALEILPQ